MSEKTTPDVPKSLGFLFADWIAAHCVVPNGYDLGKPFELVGWQLDNAIDFYRVKPDAVYDPSRPRQAAAFKWRRGQIVGGQKLGKSPFGAAVAAFEASALAFFADGRVVARCFAAVIGDAPVVSNTHIRPASRWACRVALR